MYKPTIECVNLVAEPGSQPVNGMKFWQVVDECGKPQLRQRRDDADLLYQLAMARYTSRAE